MKKIGSTGSMIPEHKRLPPETHKARNYLKDVMIAFQAILSVKIAQFINISLLVLSDAHSSKTLSFYYPTFGGISFV